MKRIFSLSLALLLCAMLALPASADVWIPPYDDGGYNEALAQLPQTEGACKPLNVFLSNYVETGLLEYDDAFPDDQLAKATLKHLELHPDAYPDAVVGGTDTDGTAYMRITAQGYEARVKALFGRTLKAEDCPGYQDGAICVTAESFGAPAGIFAHANFCEYMGDGRYYVAFTLFEGVSGEADYYAMAEIPDGAAVQSLCVGTAYFSYAGDEQTTEFRVEDFELTSLRMNVTDIPYTNENRPYTPREPLPELPPEMSAEQTGGQLSTVLLIVAVTVVAVAALTLILLKWRKKP